MSQTQRNQAGHGWRIIALLGLLLFSAGCGSAAPAEEETLATGAPVVQIAAPLPGDVYREGVGVNILVRVENAGPDLARVAIQVDGEIIGEAVQPQLGSAQTLTINNGWPAAGIGEHVISAVATRADGTSSDPVSVTINVVGSDVVSADEDDEATENTLPTSTPTQTNSDQGGAQGGDTQPTQPTAPTSAPPTEVPPTATPAPPTATPTPAVPQVRVTTGANVRSGPGVNFDPPIGSLAGGATADVLAVHTSGTWYKIEYYNGEGWISSTVVEVTGDISGLPRDAGPPTPIPATNTPVPTNTPAAAADLSITFEQTVPEFVCNQTSEITITVANTGTGPSGATRVVAEDLYNGQVTESTEAPIPALQPNESVTVVVDLTVSTNFAEAHVSRLRVDPDNVVPETNENNNTRERTYVLAPGGC